MITSIEQTPVTTVAFDDQGAYGNATCEINFSEEPPTPTPTPIPAQEDFFLLCNESYDVRINDEDVEFKGAAQAFYYVFPLPNVDLESELDTGGTTKKSTDKTNFNGVADFRIEVPISDITQTPIVTVTVDNQDVFGDAHCTIDTSESDVVWDSIINRSN